MGSELTAEKKAIAALKNTILHQGAFSLSEHEQHAGLIKAWGMGVLRRYFFYQRCVERFVKTGTPEDRKFYLMICFFRLDNSDALEALTNKLVAQAGTNKLPKPLVNAVLRRYIRERSALEEKFRGDLAVHYNMTPGLFAG